MKLLSVVLILLFTMHSTAQKCCEFKPTKNITAKLLGEKFQRLRKHKTCCDKFGSGLMNIMEMLGDSLKTGISEKSIIEIMGKPDNYATKSHPIEYHFEQLEADERVLIYCWRGMHDFLYLKIKNNQLFDKGWYYALE